MNSLRKLIANLFQLITVGLAAAFLVVFLRPQLLTGETPAGKVVEIRSSSAPAGGTAAALGSGPVSYAAAAAKAAAAVVNVHTAKVITERPQPQLEDPILRHFFGGDRGVPHTRLMTSLGSGVIVSAQGYIVTNNHVIANADEIRVQLHDGRTADARVVGTDPDTDLAVLKVKLPDLPVITMAEKPPRVGDVVLAIGNPYGVGQTVTMGIVSATGRNRLGINTYENFIQTDAAINPGNSGGALINALGNLVGINTAIYSKTGGSQGIGFAIPMSLTKGVLEQIIAHGRVIRGWFGIEAQDLTPSLAESLGLKGRHGVLVAGVLHGGPADDAGLAPGDVIMQMNGEPVGDARGLLDSISTVAPGTRVKLEGIHDGKPQQWRITVAERPASAGH